MRISAGGGEGGDNLVFLCEKHHRQFDTTDSMTTAQVTRARDELYAAFEKAVERQPPARHAFYAYEKVVCDLVRSEVAKRLGDYFRLSRQAPLQGRSGVTHMVDLAVEFTIGGLEFLVVYEVKLTRSKVQASDILQLVALLDDVGASRGALVSPAGFSTAATRLARERGIGLFHIPSQPQKSDGLSFFDITAGEGRLAR